MIGDVILIKEAEPQDIQKGDIVTYKGEEGDLNDKFITHKMIEDPQLVDGRYVFHTQGIYDGAVPDPDWYEDQLLGEFVCKIPFIDSVYSFFLKPYGLITFVLVIIVLFGYELIALILSYHTLDEIDYEENDNTEKQEKSEQTSDENKDSTDN